MGVWSTGCRGTARLQAVAVDGLVRVPLAAFTPDPQGGPARSLIVEVQGLPAPVVVFRNAAGECTALLMRCTHRGAELQLAGDRLDCPAHGSVFTDQGNVLEGPADVPLHRFPVTVTETDLLIRTA